MLWPLKAAGQFILIRYFKKEIVLFVKWIVTQFTPVYPLADAPLAYAVLRNPFYDGTNYLNTEENTTP